MGSILMHFCISDQLRKKYNFGSKFMVGSVLPDIYKRTTMSRDESHFIEKIVEDGYSYHLPNLDRFVEENKEKITTDDITIGYYAHLVEDYVWFKYVSGLFTKVKESLCPLRILNTADSRATYFKATVVFLNCQEGLFERRLKLGIGRREETHYEEQEYQGDEGPQIVRFVLFHKL